MLNLIEHVEDPVAVLAAVGRLLTPQGRILLKTPKHASLDAQLFRRSYWGGLHCPRHWVIFTPGSLESTARRAGLAVQTLEETQGAPFWCWSVLAGLAPSRRSSSNRWPPASQMAMLTAAPRRSASARAAAAMLRESARSS